MSSPPANSLPPKSSPAKPSPAHNALMSWSAVVKNPAPSKKPAAPMIPPVLENPVPAQQPPPVNARAHMPPSSMSYAQAHLPVPPSNRGRRGRGSRLGVAPAGHMSAVRPAPQLGRRTGPQPTARAAPTQAGLAGPLPAARVSLSQTGRVGQPPADPTQSPYAGGVAPSGSVYPVPVRGNVNYYRPPQAHTDAQPSTKVTKSFANEATHHSNSERRVNAERTATATTSLALMNARLDAAAADAQAGGKGTNNAAQDTNVALPAYGDHEPVGTARRSTVSGTTIDSQSSGYNLAFDTHKRTSSGPSAAGVIGSERKSGALVLSHVPQRRILTVTLSLLRSGIAARMAQDINYKMLKIFFDRVVPIGGGVPEYDEWMPSIAVAYRYPIDDYDWEIFELALSQFKLALDAEKVLGSSAAELDQVNAEFLSAELLPLQKPADEQIRGLVNRFNLH
ncbi:hypothetical protein P171DRAFT_498861 [Karstenula rhodostoma CBS 690.94]|uniref:Uncharacterized protein n=1 Tax=Karstenula rhodostoma CBS 690.94 TaxID=1392251 RepID=A0A9P4U990_9PLEO|nr:hypothetical protein P171DRAFT_498861 [Karstenula rhodostoma CBS 690.94]